VTKHVALVNGKIYTAREDEATVEAILIENRYIRATGETAEIMQMADSKNLVIDLKGKTVVPSFVDSHNHVLSAASLLQGVNCFGLRSIEELKTAVSKKASELGPGEWIVGGGWIESQFKEHRMPTRWDLDEAAPKNPVYLSRLFGMSVVNSLALEKAKITKGFRPSSGRVDLDDSGEPTGILREGAQGIVKRLVRPRADTKSRQEALERQILLALTEYLKYGITAVLDPGVNAEVMKAYASLWTKNELPIRVTAMPAWHGISAISGEYFVLPVVEAGLQPGLGDSWFKIGNLKMAIDGGLGSKTALMHFPFKDWTRATVPLRLDPNKLGAYIKEAHDAGWGVGIHCCGDLAQDMVLSHMVDVLKGRKALPHQRYHIVHGYFPTEYALRIMSEYDIPVSAQPGFIYVEGDIYPEVIDESWLSRYKPLKTYMERGIKVIINSDVSSAPFDPFVVLYGAVARKTKRGLDFGCEEALSSRQAIRCFSANGAFLAYREQECGTVEEGKLADLAVLDRDIFDGSPDDLLKAKVEATILDGEFVYLAPWTDLTVPEELKNIKVR